MRKSSRRKKADLVPMALGQIHASVRALNDIVGENSRTLLNTIDEVGRIGNMVAASGFHAIDKGAKEASRDSPAGVAARVTQNPPVVIELDRQQRGLDILHERLSALEDKVSPAMVPLGPSQQPSANGTAPSSSGSSTIATMICSRTELVEQAAVRVQRILERLEV